MKSIRIRTLTKIFWGKKEAVEAVRGVAVEVREREMVALLGPNGAGKSTTLRMLTTLLAPTTGSATVAGIDVTADPDGVLRRIGYVGQGNGAGHWQRVRDELLSQGRCYGLGGTASRERADELLASLELEPLAKRHTASLSGGQRRRLVESEGVMGRRGARLPTRYTHRQLGSMIGANREAVTRALGKLRRGGIIEVRERRIHVVDIEALRRAAQQA